MRCCPKCAILCWWHRKWRKKKRTCHCQSVYKVTIIATLFWSFYYCLIHFSVRFLTLFLKFIFLFLGNNWSCLKLQCWESSYSFKKSHAWYRYAFLSWNTNHIKLFLLQNIHIKLYMIIKMYNKYASFFFTLISASLTFCVR